MPMKLLSIVIFIFSVALSSCEKPNSIENSLLSMEPCGPPCFFDIIPQKSTKQDVFDSLDKFGLNNRCKSTEPTRLENISVVECIHSIIKIGIDETEDVVNSIEFSPNSRITIESVINTYGEPDFLKCYSVNTTSEKPSSNVMIFFKKESMGIIIENFDGYFANIRPDTLINTVIYSASFVDNQEKKGFTQQWKGYSEYPAWP